MMLHRVKTDSHEMILAREEFSCPQPVAAAQSIRVLGIFFKCCNKTTVQAIISYIFIP